MTDIDVTIKALGAKGDGVAEAQGGAIFVPFAAPGDLVKLRLSKSKDGTRRGKILSITEPGPDRHLADPPGLHRFRLRHRHHLGRRDSTQAAE